MMDGRGGGRQQAGKVGGWAAVRDKGRQCVWGGRVIGTEKMGGWQETMNDINLGEWVTVVGG